jgi:rhodanese-related sulfurtransferase
MTTSIAQQTINQQTINQQTIDQQTINPRLSSSVQPPTRFEPNDLSGASDAGSIEREELRARLERAEPLVLLEALPERYYRKAHLPGARLMPDDQVSELAASLIPSLTSAVVVYCASATCRNSDRAAAALRELGYENVRVYREGKADWQAAGLPVEGG